MIFSLSAATSSKSSLFQTPNVIKASKTANYNHSRSSLISDNSVVCGATKMTKEEESVDERVELTISILIRKNNSLSRTTTPSAARITLSLSSHYPNQHHEDVDRQPQEIVVGDAVCTTRKGNKKKVDC